jgi:two-component system, cell cycle sensor histidine kinase and response regulator CckA
VNPEPKGSAQPVDARTTIMLVEDETSVRGLFSHVLARRGFRVLEACDGVDALRVFTENMDAIDLVISDIVMPKMNGRELATHLRLVRPGIRVILMSGYTDEALVRPDTLGPGMVFLQKPLRSETLLAAVLELLNAPPAPFDPK